MPTRITLHHSSCSLSKRIALVALLKIAKRGNRSNALSLSKNERFDQKTEERIPNPARRDCLLSFCLNTPSSTVSGRLSGLEPVAAASAYSYTSSRNTPALIVYSKPFLIAMLHYSTGLTGNTPLGFEPQPSSPWSRVSVDWILQAEQNCLFP